MQYAIHYRKGRYGIFILKIISKYLPVQPRDAGSSTKGKGKEGEEDFLTNTATQPTTTQHSKPRHPPPFKEKNATLKDPRDSHLTPK